MKITVKYLSIILFLSISVLFISFGGQKAEWKGKIEIEDGVKVINNPGEPLYGEITFELEEDLSIGGEDDENYLFYSVRDIGVDDDGNIYVLERGNLRIQKFDRDGNYLCTMGRIGQGPGEFEWAFQLLINDENGIIGMLENRKIIVFDMDGNHLDKDISLVSFMFPLIVDSSGNYWGVDMEYLEGDYVTGNIFHIFVKLDQQGQIVKKIAKFPFHQFQERSGEGSRSTTTGEEYDLRIESVGEKNIVYGYSKEYELNIINLDGDLVLKISKDEPYQKFTSVERKKYKEIKLPTHRPFFYYLYSDSEGRIYTLKNNVFPLEDKEREFDIFSKDGYYLYRTVIPFIPFVIKDGFFYTRILDNDTGGVFVRRYKIKNWDQIKTGI